jgi:hypothetical protein
MSRPNMNFQISPFPCCLPSKHMFLSDFVIFSSSEQLTRSTWRSFTADFRIWMAGLDYSASLIQWRKIILILFSLSWHFPENEIKSAVAQTMQTRAMISHQPGHATITLAVPSTDIQSNKEKTSPADKKCKINWPSLLRLDRMLMCERPIQSECKHRCTRHFFGWFQQRNSIPKSFSGLAGFSWGDWPN